MRPVIGLMMIMFLLSSCTQGVRKEEQTIMKEALIGSWQAVSGKLVKKDGQVVELDMEKEQFQISFGADGTGFNSSMQQGVLVKRPHEWVLDGNEMRIYEKLHPYLEIWKLVDVKPDSMVCRIIFNNDPDVAEGVFRFERK